jgi:crossover junction endodeoxyribonuclease RusA
VDRLMIVLPWPPTVNTYWRTVGGRMLISKGGRQYRDAVAELAALHKWPKYGAARLSVQIEAWMPDKRRRDLDNLLKSMLDSLTHAGVWDDDSQIDGLAIWRAPMLGGMCKVEIAEVP